VESLGVELEQIRELIEQRQIGRYGMELGIVAAGVLIEVDAGVGAFIHRGGIVAGNDLELRSVGGRSRGLGRASESYGERKTSNSGRQAMAHGFLRKTKDKNKDR
jgi:hypothetical protein